MTRFRCAACCATVLALAAASLSACGSPASAPAAQSLGSATAVARYGYGPSHDPSVKYQPGVVLIGGGPDAIRAVSPDGVTWTLDAAAQGVGDLSVGKVMFASSRAVGRVAALRRQGADEVVTLAPVNLGDLLSGGSLNLDQDIDPTALTAHDYPALPAGTLSTPTAETATPDALELTPRGGTALSAAPALFLTTTGAGSAALSTAPSRRPDVTAKGELTMGDWTFRPVLDTSKLGLGVYYNQSKLKVGASVEFTHAKLHLRASGGIDGDVPGGGVVLSGITGLHLGFEAGLGGDTKDNVKIRVELPVVQDFEIPPSPETAGLPMVVQVAFKLIVETALSGRNSTITASGDFALNGDIGVTPRGAVTPTWSVQHSLLDSIAGITLAPSGLVVGVELKLTVGVGIPAAMAGPYILAYTAASVANGSVLGSPLAQCRSAGLDIKIGAGIRSVVSARVADALKALLPKGTKLEFALETLIPVIHKSQTFPDVPLCTGSS